MLRLSLKIGKEAGQKDVGSDPQPHLIVALLKQEPAIVAMCPVVRIRRRCLLHRSRQLLWGRRRKGGRAEDVLKGGQRICLARPLRRRSRRRRLSRRSAEDARMKLPCGFRVTARGGCAREAAQRLPLQRRWRAASRLSCPPCITAKTLRAQSPLPKKNAS